MNNNATSSNPVNEIGPTARSVVSLWLVLHVTSVACVLSSNLNPSQLQNRLSTTFAPYTQTLHLHPGFTRFHFTSSDSFADEHFLVVETKTGSTRVKLPGDESPWGLERRRLAALGLEVAYFADRDEMAGYYARAVGGRILREQKIERALISCVQKLSQPMNLDRLEIGFPPDNPDANEYLNTIYQAEVWLDEDGELNLQKRSVGRNAAPSATRAANSSAGPSSTKSGSTNSDVGSPAP